MNTAENKQTVRRIYDAINARDVAALSSLIADDVHSETKFPHHDRGLAGFMESFQSALTAFPDYAVHVDDQIAEGDKVVTRYTATGTQEGDFLGIPATGRKVEIMAIDIDRLVDGVVVEHWSEANLEDVVVRLGVIQPR